MHFSHNFGVANERITGIEWNRARIKVAQFFFSDSIRSASARLREISVLCNQISIWKVGFWLKALQTIHTHTKIYRLDWNWISIHFCIQSQLQIILICVHKASTERNAHHIHQMHWSIVWAPHMQMHSLVSF